jgi:hypothetical protein
MPLLLKLSPSTGRFPRAARFFIEESIATKTTTSRARPIIMPGPYFYFPFMVANNVK